MKYLPLACLLFTVVACSSNSDPEPKAIPEISHPETINIRWLLDVLSPSTSGSFVPVIDNGTIFTSDSYGNIFRIDQSDGTIINHFHSKRKFSSGTAVSSDSIFVTTTDGYLLSIDKVGKKINWQAELPTISVEAPQVSNGIVVIRTNDSEILAYDASNGSLLWLYQKPIPALTLRAYNTFQVIGKDVVIVGQPSGRLALLNLTTGVPIWENYISFPSGATDLDKMNDVSVRPVLNDNQICAATYNGEIACIDAMSSNKMWSNDFSTSYGVLDDEQNVYSLSEDGILYAYDKNTGAKIWSNNVLQYRSLSVPVFLNNNILLIDKAGEMYLFNRNDGKMVAMKSSSLKDGVAYPWSDGKKVIIQSGNGEIAEINQ